MILAVLVFVVVVGAVVGGYFAISSASERSAQERLEQRLKAVAGGPDESVDEERTLVRTTEGRLPAVDRIVSRTAAGTRLTRLIQQSGVNTTPGGLVLTMIAFAAVAGVIAKMFATQWYVPLIAGAFAGIVPLGYVINRRSARLRRFEEQFPEALDLLSRALRAGHAFQTAMGMVADEMSEPVGPEFKKSFDQQNFGLPLREALNQLSDRVPLIDVRFFVTAVVIQRETGGNLSEILDNLAHVVRERFKILRQVRVHTAHGRLTAFVLLALPAVLAIALSTLNPDHMKPLFQEQIGQTMIVTAIVMQTIGFFWIRKVIKIEV
jgi:tight adherence protein B